MRHQGVTRMRDDASDPDSSADAIEDLLTRIERDRADDRPALTEPEAKELLSAAGVPVPDHGVAETADAAVDLAERIGYPVVVKVSAPSVQHKSEWGDGAGVALGLTDPTAVREAAEDVFAAADARDVDAAVLVEEAVDLDAGTEVILGGTHDEAFGPTLLFGLGGVFTEVLEDVSHRLAPIDEDEAVEMTTEIRGEPLLEGYRGTPPADRRTLASTIVTVGDLLTDYDLQEVEINPLLATEDGVVALDALVVR